MQLYKLGTLTSIWILQTQTGKIQIQFLSPDFSKKHGNTSWVVCRIENHKSLDEIHVICQPHCVDILYVLTVLPQAHSLLTGHTNKAWTGRWPPLTHFIWQSVKHFSMNCCVENRLWILSRAGVTLWFSIVVSNKRVGSGDKVTSGFDIGVYEWMHAWMFIYFVTYTFNCPNKFR